MERRKYIPCFLLLLLLAGAAITAQGQLSRYNRAKQQFEGLWHSRSSDMYMRFFFDADDTTYVTVNEWKGRHKGTSIDAYKVFIEGDKLVFPEDRTEHRHPRCEMQLAGQRLLCRCRSLLAEPAGPFTENEYYTRVKTKR